jgi:hypothetical protein
MVILRGVGFGGEGSKKKSLMKRVVYNERRFC